MKRESEAPSDARLIEAVLGGEAGAFAALVDRYMGFVHSIAQGILGSASEADDATQEAFLRVHRGSLADFDLSWSFRAWIARVTRNVSLNMLRTRRSRLTAERAAGNLRQGVAQDRSQPGERFTKAEEELFAALMRLPEKQRTALRLFHVEGISYAEIADTMGVPMGTVKTYIHRGREALRTQLTAGGRRESCGRASDGE